MVKVVLEINAPELTEEIANELNRLIDMFPRIESWEEVVEE